MEFRQAVKMDRLSSFYDPVSTAIWLRMRQRDFSADGTARIMYTSVRTLQRRLGVKGLTFREALDRMSMTEAGIMLQDPDRSMTEIAWKLGYNDMAHFTRAFRRWKGVPPTQFRRQLRLQDPAGPIANCGRRKASI